MNWVFLITKISCESVLCHYFLRKQNERNLDVLRQKLIQSKIGYYYKSLFSQPEYLSIESNLKGKTGMAYRVSKKRKIAIVCVSQ